MDASHHCRKPGLIRLQPTPWYDGFLISVPTATAIMTKETATVIGQPGKPWIAVHRAMTRKMEAQMSSRVRAIRKTLQDKKN